MHCIYTWHIRTPANLIIGFTRKEAWGLQWFSLLLPLKTHEQIADWSKTITIFILVLHSSSVASEHPPASETPTNRKKSQNTIVAEPVLGLSDKDLVRMLAEVHFLNSEVSKMAFFCLCDVKIPCSMDFLRHNAKIVSTVALKTHLFCSL